MLDSRKLWTGLSLLLAVAGASSLVLGAVGYALGWNDTGGVRYHSNVVPLSLLLGLVLLCAGGAVLLARAPEILTKLPTGLAILLLAAISWFFVLLGVRHEKALITVRADIVMGSESQFVDHIIRFRVGQPQYTPPGDANSSPYTPGAPLLTYFIAWALGRPTSIPVFRLVQQLYLLLAVLLAAAAARELFRVLRPGNRLQNTWLWFWLPFLYLMATNPHTNVYTQVLYSDALALMASALAFWLMVKHFASADDRWLIPLAIVPSLGFLAKQKEAIWTALTVVYLVLAGRHSWRRILLFGLASFGLLGLTVGICYGLWGPSFYFWTLGVLSRLHIWLQKVLEQVADSGWYILLGLLGGLALLRRENFRRLFPLWFCWLLQVFASAYTSGIAFRPAHLGPATLVGGVWFLVALAMLWPGTPDDAKSADRTTLWWRTVIVPAGVFVCLMSAGFLRLGPVVPEGLERYIVQVEKEFEGLPRERVLLDTGSWVYLSQNVVMKDRESPIGVLWGTGASDFADTIRRLREHYYDKILVRKMKDGQFLYRDPRIRRALSEYYREVRVIPSPGIPDTWLYEALLYDISILEPASNRSTENR